MSGQKKVPGDKETWDLREGVCELWNIQQSNSRMVYVRILYLYEDFHQ